MAKHRYTKEEVEEWRRKNNRYFAYFNKDDSNFVVLKPSGFGWTLNWAHPFSLVVGAAVIMLLAYLLTR